MRSLEGQISLRQMMIIVALMAFISAIGVSYLRFRDAYWKGIIEPPAGGPARPLRRPTRPPVPPPPGYRPDLSLAQGLRCWCGSE
jgi:hypothetical protein